MDKLLQGDCLKLLKDIDDNSIDMILCDLPYGQTHNKWDSVIPLDKLWKQYKRVIKKNGCVALFGQGMFTADLMYSNKKWWRYNLIWDKVLTAGFLNANRMPLRSHEDIVIFYKQLPTYNSQKVIGNKNHSKGKLKKNKNHNYGTHKFVDNTDKLGNMKHPKSILSFQKPHPATMIHPTEKPVGVCEWLIKSYTNEGDIVLDNCMGSGTTGVACKNTNRKFIGMELDKIYFKEAKKRINKKTIDDFF
tara:strand:+ start:37 stop:777 length:741 start_codon:yes stop_codon:yes gene_type:complete